jgi:hypothetical protein
MVSVLAFSVVDHGFISGVMVSVLTSSVVDRGFINGVMVSVLTSSVVDTTDVVTKLPVNSPNYKVE